MSNIQERADRVRLHSSSALQKEANKLKLLSEILRSSPKSLVKGNVKPVIPSQGGFLPNSKYTKGMDDVMVGGAGSVLGAGLAGLIGNKSIEALSPADPNIAAPTKEEIGKARLGSGHATVARQEMADIDRKLKEQLERIARTEKAKVDRAKGDAETASSEKGEASPSMSDRELKHKAIGGAAGAGLGYLGSKAVGKLTGNDSALRDVLSGTIGAGAGVAAGDYYSKTATHNFQGYMAKSAGPVAEYLASMPAHSGIGAAAGKVDYDAGGDVPIASILSVGSRPAASGAGLFMGASEEDLDRMNSRISPALLPYVADVRQGRRLGATLRRSEEDNPGASRAKGNLISEFTGPVTSTAGLALSGGAIGGILGGEEGAQAGAAMGTGASAVGHSLMALVAAVRKRRRREEQSEQDRESNVLDNLLLPGAGMYGALKRLGSTGKPYA
jgi:hypothetical protein